MHLRPFQTGTAQCRWAPGSPPSGGRHRPPRWPFAKPLPCVVALLLLLQGLWTLPAGAAPGNAAQYAAQTPMVQVRLDEITATVSAWSLRQRLVPAGSLTVHAATNQDALLILTVRRDVHGGPPVYHLKGRIALANPGAAPLAIARLTVQLTGTSGRAVTPLIPVNFSSPLAAGAQATFPYTADVHLDTGGAAATAGSSLAIHAVATVLINARQVLIGDSVPLGQPLPAPQLIAASQVTVSSGLRLTDTSTFVATPGKHPAGATVRSDGAVMIDSLALPVGGSRTFVLGLQLTARRSGTGRVIGTSELAAAGTDVTDCGAGAACPSIGAVLIGGD